MTREEAIKRIKEHIDVHRIGYYPHIKLREALNMAIAALREHEERDNPKPLTLDELKRMDEDPVWIKLFEPDEEFWVLRNEWVDIRCPEPLILFHMRWYSHADYGKTWLAYRNKPKEDSK